MAAGGNLVRRTLDLDAVGDEKAGALARDSTLAR
jgi:hypothetical protein